MRRGFTLLEVVIALVILTMTLFVLVNAQSSSVFMTTDSQKILTGTWLAQQKLTEAMLRIEVEGVQVSDIDESGDFQGFGADGEFGDGVDFADEYQDYAWAYTIRAVDLQVGDLASNADALKGAGIGPPEGAESSGTKSSAADASMIQPEMVSQMLKPYIREVRVVIWWDGDEPGTDDPCENCVEIVTHLANPTGLTTDGSKQDQQTAL